MLYDNNIGCKTQQAILTQGYETRIQNMEQTTALTGVMNAGFNLLGNKIDAQTQTMLNSFQGLKDYFTNEKINALQLENSQLRQTNTIQAVVDAATTPIQNRVQDLLARVPVAPVPSYNVSQYGYYGVIPNNNCGCGCGCGCGPYGA